jgi:hypothetical protein
VAVTQRLGAAMKMCLLHGAGIFSSGHFGEAKLLADTSP